MPMFYGRFANSWTSAPIGGNESREYRMLGRQSWAAVHKEFISRPENSFAGRLCYSLSDKNSKLMPPRKKSRARMGTAVRLEPSGPTLALNWQPSVDRNWYH